MNITRAIQGFIFQKETEGASPNTLPTYRRDLLRFAAFCATLDIQKMSDVTADHVRRYLYHLRTDAGLAPKTVKNHWIALSSLWTWAGQRLKIPHIVREVPCPKAPPPEIVPLTKEEIVTLLDATNHARRYNTNRRRAVKRQRPEASRDRAIILLLLDTGMRVSELAKCTIADLDLRSGHIFIRKAKHRLTTKSRHVYFGKSTRQALFDYLADREEKLGEPPQEDAPLIAATNWRTPVNRHVIQRLLSRCGKRAGVNGVYPHRFRHTFAINYLRNGGDPFTLQQLLGHSSLDMVKLYIRLAEQDLATTHRRASPADNWHL